MHVEETEKDMITGGPEKRTQEEPTEEDFLFDDPEGEEEAEIEEDSEGEEEPEEDTDEEKSPEDGEENKDAPADKNTPDGDENGSDEGGKKKDSLQAQRENSNGRMTPSTLISMRGLPISTGRATLPNTPCFALFLTNSLISLKNGILCGIMNSERWFSTP